LNISFENYQGEALLEIVNITGQSILQSDIQFSNGLAKVNLSVLSGVYFIKITPENENKTYIEKIIKE